MDTASEYAQSIVNTVREPLVVLDGKFRVISANRSFYSTFKVTPEMSENTLLFDLGNRQWDIPALRKLLEEVLPNSTTIEDFEVEHDFPAIGQKTMLLNARRIPEPPGAIRMILLAIEDITERRRAEDALREAKDQLDMRLDEVGERTRELSALYNLSRRIGRVFKHEDVFRLAADAINEVMDFDLVGVLHVAENEKEIVITRAVTVSDSAIEEACDILINTFNDIKGTSLSRNIFEPVLVDATDFKKGAVSAESLESYTWTPLNVGDTLIGTMILTSSNKDAFNEGRLRLFTTVANETGSTIQRLDSLKESEERRTRTIIDSISEGVLLVETNGEIILKNPVGEGICEFLEVAGGASVIEDIVNEALAEPESHVERESEASLGDLTRAYRFEATTIPGIDGNIMGTAVIIRDITMERDTERLRGSFLSSISHELRTPLTSVKEYIAILLDGYGGEPSGIQRDCLEVAFKNAERLQLLIEDLLTVSRIEAHGFSINRTDVPFSDIEDLCVQSFLPRAGNKGVSLEWDSKPVPTVYADPLRIGQVLTNLLDNAWKSTPSGGEIEIRTEVEGDYLLVTVSDTGLGIPKDAIPHIFDLFYKVSTGEKFGADGTGLGLYTSHEIVTAHGGRIWVESKLGDGTTFFFTLPISSKPEGLLHFITDAIEYSLRHKSFLSVGLLHLESGKFDEKTLLHVKQSLRSEDRILAYGKDLENAVLVLFVDEGQLELVQSRLLSAILHEYPDVEPVFFSRKGEPPPAFCEKVLKTLASFHQEKE